MPASSFPLRTILTKTTALNFSGTTVTSSTIRSNKEIEQLVFTGEIDSIRPTAGKIGRAARIDDALGRYVEFAKRSFPRGMSLEEMRVAVDVANGAGYKSTPCILRELGAEVIVAHNEPNGTNINAQCGSTYPEEIQRIVKESGAHVGITHDGDADRVLLCDENGEIVDGDEILAIAAVDLLRAGRLEQNTLVATVMSNFGLDETLAAHGGKVVRTKVGDRYVIEEMVQRKLNLGGEQSGHIIFRDFTTTGDGIISALQILRIMHETGEPLSKLKSCLKKYPQAQRNLKVKSKPPIEELREVVKLRDEVERELAGKGRVLLRYSGTEPKIRLLIEGRELDKIDKQANRIADAIQNAIGRINKNYALSSRTHDGNDAGSSNPFALRMTAISFCSARKNRSRQKRLSMLSSARAKPRISPLTNSAMSAKQKWPPRSSS